MTPPRRPCARPARGAVSSRLLCGMAEPCVSTGRARMAVQFLRRVRSGGGVRATQTKTKTIGLLPHIALQGIGHAAPRTRVASGR